MNPEALAKLQQQVRVGGKGTPRRKAKKAAKPAVQEDSKLSGFYRSLKFRPIPGIEHVNIFTTEGKVRHFANPIISASSISNNAFSITGHSEEKDIAQVPSALRDLEADYLELLQRMKAYQEANPEAFKKAAEGAEAAKQEQQQGSEEIPDLIEAIENANIEK
ncbi:Nascent polypeptide-associated complex subunit beta [Spiromyces aspiralis]|uniref:Nascent polypeptide-associated complex subunit beta n=1 Tax=Spiromyces aspiralis TaxID=68401 RepID=A0ACC1HD54_9FUNG|nr:Nascent polypeptide-associated complex subunit beta [Spiromyces aspiralis]